MRECNLKVFAIEDVLDIKLGDSGIEFLVKYSQEENCPDEWLHISALDKNMQTCLYKFYNKVSTQIIKGYNIYLCRLPNYHSLFVVFALLLQNLLVVARSVPILFVRFVVGELVGILEGFNQLGVLQKIGDVINVCVTKRFVDSFAF